MNRAIRLAFACVVVFVVCARESSATPNPPASPSTATTETLGAITRTDGWCVSATTAIANAWTSAPTRITNVKNAIRFVKVVYADRTASGDLCVRLGPTDTPTSATMTCSLNDKSSDPLQSLGAFVSWVLARDAIATKPSSPLASPAPIWIQASAATVTTCVVVGW